MTDDSQLNRKELLFPNEILWAYDLRREMQEIIPGLFLGPYASAVPKNKNSLLNAGITHIVCVRRSDESKLIRDHFKGEFTYKIVDIRPEDFSAMTPLLKDVNDFIDSALRQNGKVLVHGLNGSTCSPIFVIAYIIARTDMKTDEAFKYVTTRRFCVFPPEEYMVQLRNFEAVAKASLKPIDIEMRQALKRKMEEGNDKSVKKPLLE